MNKGILGGMDLGGYFKDEEQKNQNFQLLPNGSPGKYESEFGGNFKDKVRTGLTSLTTFEFWQVFLQVIF
mgnify:CR=1 FL=1